MTDMTPLPPETTQEWGFDPGAAEQDLRALKHAIENIMSDAQGYDSFYALLHNPAVQADDDAMVELALKAAVFKTATTYAINTPTGLKRYTFGEECVFNMTLAVLGKINNADLLERVGNFLPVLPEYQIAQAQRHRELAAIPSAGTRTVSAVGATGYPPPTVS